MTPKQKFLRLLALLASTLRDLGPTPTPKGPIYAALMAECNLEDFESAMSMLYVLDLITLHSQHQVAFRPLTPGCKGEKFMQEVDKIFPPSSPVKG